MPKGFFNIPEVKNEPVLSYAPGTPERKELQEKIKELRAMTVSLPMIIGGREVTTDKKIEMRPPHDLGHLLGHYYQGDASHVSQAIDAALEAREKWSKMSWQHRASIFLKAADLLAGPYRSKINAATMLGQSKNAFQSEIDAACELADFYRYGVKCMVDIYEMQPESSKGIWNYAAYRPLEGFVFALTPFNFTSIAGNLPVAPALMGNTVVWKPSKTAVYSAAVIMEVLREAGVPDGVINLVHVSGPTAADVVFNHPDFAGIHFTGSTGVFQNIWKTIGENIHKYKTYPRIVGETGGKDFIFAHKSADVKALATAVVRGAFEFQGQKCSAASRAYIPASIWQPVLDEIKAQTDRIKMGDVCDFGNFVNAVIDQAAFKSITAYIDYAKDAKDAEIPIGGGYDDSKGWFIEPTVITTTNPNFKTMEEEIFGPVMTMYCYQDDAFEATLELCDQTSPYSLTGAIFSQDRVATSLAMAKLVNASGNFYINDKPTGAVVGQQPFGGARASGTNDKAGSKQNLMRWASVRAVKENFVPPTTFEYPFMDPE